MNKAYLLLGSNMGNEYLNLKTAIAKISELAGPVKKVSSLYTTAAWGGHEQRDYLNQVIEIETTLGPLQLLDKVMLIEQDMGRKRSLKYEPRLIDIDILFYNDWIVQEANLRIPHQHLHLRKFTLVPLNEIAADLVHPEMHVSVAELLKICTDTLKVELIQEA